jgi:hypothetical protein
MELLLPMWCSYAFVAFLAMSDNVESRSAVTTAPQTVSSDLLFCACVACMWKIGTRDENHESNIIA